jgi:hypothetical protein
MLIAILVTDHSVSVRAYIGVRDGGINTVAILPRSLWNGRQAD